MPSIADVTNSLAVSAVATIFAIALMALLVTFVILRIFMNGCWHEDGTPIKPHGKAK